MRFEADNDCWIWAVDRFFGLDDVSESGGSWTEYCNISVGRYLEEIERAN